MRPIVTLARFPRSAWLVAVLAGLLHLVPFLWAQSLTPAGLEFTGNRSVSPDYMQYRAWFRQSQVFGPVVPDLFTSEPNQPHLPVIFYYAVGKGARWIGVGPEFVYAYAGSVFAFAFTLLLFATVRVFVPNPHQLWWVFLTLLIGGGLGAQLNVLTMLEPLKTSAFFRAVLIEPMERWPVFDNYRGHYVFTVLVDTHFTLNWMLTTAGAMSLYAVLRHFTAARLIIMCALYGAMTLLHFYEGITLLAITAGVTCLCWTKQIAVRPALLALAAGTASILAVIGWQSYLMLVSGIPAPSWREGIILPTILLLAYPLAWVLGFWGLGRLWRESGLEGTFLLGWALGCTILTLSGPYYPYPSRGTVTLQIPVSIIGGLVYFRTRPRVTMRAAVIAVLVLGLTPILFLARSILNTPDGPALYLDAAHRDVIDILRDRARPTDVLLADSRDILWLAPEYPGRHYCAHFFLTVDFERKTREVEAFFKASPGAQAEFLRAKSVRFLYVAGDQQRARFEAGQGLTTLKRTPVGSLFEFTNLEASRR